MYVTEKIMKNPIYICKRIKTKDFPNIVFFLTNYNLVS